MDKAAVFYLKALGLHIIVGKPDVIEETQNRVGDFIFKAIPNIKYLINKGYYND